jgi:hypothetical protein
VRPVRLQTSGSAQILRVLAFDCERRYRGLRRGRASDHME